MDGAIATDYLKKEHYNELAEKKGTPWYVQLIQENT